MSDPCVETICHCGKPSAKAQHAISSAGIQMGHPRSSPRSSPETAVFPVDMFLLILLAAFHSRDGSRTLRRLPPLLYVQLIQLVAGDEP